MMSLKILIKSKIKKASAFSEDKTSYVPSEAKSGTSAVDESLFKA
jgi:hypothetical protein